MTEGFRGSAHVTMRGAQQLWSLGATAHQSSDHRHERVRINGLRDMHLIPRKKRPLACVVASICGQGCCWRLTAPAFGQCPNSPNQRIPILLRQADVAHNDVRAPLLKYLETLLRRGRHADLYTCPCHDARYQL